MRGADFWMTMQRRALASFTGSMYEDEFKLIVPVTQPETDYIAKMMGDIDAVRTRIPLLLEIYFVGLLYSHSPW